MKILVYGAGNIGRLYAARLAASGQNVTILARGRRLADLHRNGVRLEHAGDGSRTTERVGVIEALDPEAAYDLVLVVLPMQAVGQVLPVLAASRGTPSVMFFGNDPTGPEHLCAALGRERVLLGFPGAAALEADGRLRFLILSAREQPTTIGELDGARSDRIRAIAEVLRAAGFPVSIGSNMDAWLKTHAAEIAPTAGALFMAGLDVHRLGRTRDARVLMVRAIREGYRVLSALGIPITPPSHRLFRLLPEPLLLVLMRRAMESEETQLKVGHAAAARAEMKALCEALNDMARTASVPTPASDRLYRFLEPEAAAAPDGSAEIAVDRSAVWIGLGVLALILAMLSRS